MEEVEDFRSEDYPLLPVAVGVWEGGVFLNLDPDAESLAEALAPLIGEFGPWAVSELKVAHEIVYDV